jgi:hypothetical protein
VTDADVTRCTSARKNYDAAFSASAFHLPDAARPFIFARCKNAA